MIEEYYSISLIYSISRFYLLIYNYENDFIY